MKGFCLEVSGEYACFTRPEMKMERVSYDVITPSSARSIFEAILWKPAIRWNVKMIEVLTPIRWLSIRRNEVAKTASDRTEHIFIEDKGTRQQRAGLILRDVKYRLHAEFELIPKEQRIKVSNSVPERLMEPVEISSHQNESEAKYAAMFQRRASKGQCFHQPYLGCREFACRFKLIQDEMKLSQPIEETRDLGWMLYDLDFSNPAVPTPMWFRCRMDKGVIIVPRSNSQEVRK